jgi:hypothetical protein
MKPNQSVEIVHIVQATLDSGEWYDHGLDLTAQTARDTVRDAIKWDKKFIGCQKRSYRIIERRTTDRVLEEYPALDAPVPHIGQAMNLIPVALFEDENTGDIWANNIAQGTWRRLSFTDYRSINPPTTTSPCQNPPLNPTTP